MILPNKSYIKNGKSIVANIKMSDLFTKEKLDLGNFSLGSRKWAVN